MRVRWERGWVEPALATAPSTRTEIRHGEGDVLSFATRTRSSGRTEVEGKNTGCLITGVVHSERRPAEQARGRSLRMRDRGGRPRRFHHSLDTENVDPRSRRPEKSGAGKWPSKTPRGSCFPRNSHTRGAGKRHHFFPRSAPPGMYALLGLGVAERFEHDTVGGRFGVRAQHRGSRSG